MRIKIHLTLVVAAQAFHSEWREPVLKEAATAQGRAVNDTGDMVKLLDQFSHTILH